MDIKQNMNIFRGTNAEIKLLERQGKIINYCFYFAWDTGTFYLGSSTKTLQKYGSNKDTLSRIEIESLLQKLLTNELSLFIEQVSEARKIANEALNTRVTYDEDAIINTVYNKAILELNKRIDELDLSPINNKIKDALETYDLNVMSTYIKAINGDAALKAIANDNVTHYYYILENSTDMNNTFTQGNTYYVKNMVIKNITENSFLANNYVKPVINMQLADITPVMIAGQDLVKTELEVKYSIDNMLYLNDNLQISVNDTIVKTNIKKNENLTLINISLTSVPVGTIEIKMSGTDIRNKNVSTSYTIEVLAPIYYGPDDSKMLSTEIENEFNKLSSTILTNIYTSYDMQLSKGQYMWFLIPNTYKISTKKFYTSGFSVPFQFIKSVQKLINNVYVTYDCYRSTYSIEAGEYTIEIRE